MKNKLITISLLLSFLMVIAHVVIPHHHHEGSIVEYSAACESDNESDRHNADCERTSHDYDHSFYNCGINDTQEHFHDYAHNHQPTDCHVMEIARRSSNTELSRLNRILLPLFAITFLDTNLSDSDTNTKIIYTEFQYTVPSLFIPEANALRGPPSFA